MLSFTAIRKEAGVFCGTFLRKGEVFACVVLSQNLKDLKAIHDLTNRGGEDRTGQDRTGADRGMGNARIRIEGWGITFFAV